MPDDVKNAIPVSSSAEYLHFLLDECVRRDASDLHLSPGLPAYLRIDGNLKPCSTETLKPAHTDAMAVALRDLTGSTAALYEEQLDRKGSIDGALSARDGTRFRFNIFKRQRQLVLVLRRLEDRFRSLTELGLPENLYALCDLRDGLVIMSGPTGAGKSTTLATLIDRVNRTRESHVITIEDPIEYVHKPVKSIVNQRQVGIDAPSFNDALVAAMRQDPDVVLVGEIRDLETIRTAITAAETGHLVFTTLHAGDCVGSIERLVSVFPAGEQEGIRRQLALVLRAVISQHLLPSAPVRDSDGKQSAGVRIATSEVLMVNPAVSNLIGSGKSAQIYSIMETGQGQGMQTLEQDLARLWVAGRITEAVAVATARNVNVLKSRVAMLRKRSGMEQVGNA